MADSASSEELLIVEDDEKLAALLAEYLEGSGFRVARVGRGDTAVERILASPPRLVVLDIMLPGLDGMEVCRRVRPQYPGPILMLTARKSEVDEVLGLELGADDYVTKPVIPRTLLARIRSLLRRTEAPADTPVTSLTVGELTVDQLRREAHVGDAALGLTATEFGILWMLAARAGQAVTREELYRDVTHASWDGLDRGMDVHISRIRRKLELAGATSSAIKSIRGSGYVLARR
ncbi:response regulator transcription factor [Myxococcota bacterium]|nr:response regulator transcription factor [Myxococcota bacterium]